MPKPRQKERVICQYYVWNLGRRNGVYFADGRSNQPSLGRQSLGTRGRAEALESLRELDEVMAVRHGRIRKEQLSDTSNAKSLELVEGWHLYRAHVSRPHIAGGAKPTTAKRYRAIFDKFIAFANSQGVQLWNHVDRQMLESYAAWLDDNDYAYRTEYIELTTLKQAVKWFVTEGILPSDRVIVLPLKKAIGSDTYCWTPEQVQAMRERCQANESLAWLDGIIVTLACTGLRISELAGLRWSDVDTAANQILLTDESRSARKQKRERRETKSGRSRSFPIHSALEKVLDQTSRASDGLIFHGPLGGRLKPDRLRQILIREVLTPLEERFPSGEDEIGFKDGRLHSFRHYFCSVCANRGVPEQLLMTWLGHRNSAMVKHYYHVHNEQAQQEMCRLDFV
ncbi:MAG: tyrosine-type recombinase/integrase [Planctomycetales bacterium]|jgi:integrase